jgi:hypothetical protein
MSKKEFDDLLDMGDTSDLDNILLSEEGEDDLVEKMDKQQEKAVEERTPWLQDFKEHWYWYLILALSFLLTETTAIYLGLAPYLAPDPSNPGQQAVFWNTDFGHMATMLVYMLLFPAVTELAFDRAWKKYSKREPGNLAQAGTMIAAIVVSALAILGTGVSGTYVVFATLGSVGLIEIPHSVQLWLIWVVPSLLALFGILHGVYKAKSKMEKLNRLVEYRLERARLSEQLRNKITEQKVQRAISNSARRSYIQAVALGLLSKKEAEEGMAAGKSLVQLEKELNRDLTGEGKIGDTSGLNHRPAPTRYEREMQNAPKQPVFAPQNLLWNRGNDQSAYHDPNSEHALPCGHTGGAADDRKGHILCNVCGADVTSHFVPVRTNGQNP